MKKIFLLLLLSLVFVQAESGLSWNSKKTLGKGALGQKIIELSFAAENRSSQNIVINSAKVTCDCMIVTGDFPRTIKPGEKMILNAEYDTTGKLGLNRGRILVEVAGKTETLLVEVDIPTAVTLSPRFLIWPKGERPSKTATIEIHKDWQGKITKVGCKDPSIKASLEKTETGYSISIRPDKGLPKKRTWVIVEGLDSEKKPLEYRIYLIFN